MIYSSDRLNSLVKIGELSSKSANAASTNTIGVIIDMTRPLYRELEQNFIVEIKIVDETLNQNRSFGGFVKFCSIYLFSKNRNEIEFAASIGQIVFLQNFTFSVWNQIKLETKYQSTIEKIYSYDLDHNVLTQLVGVQMENAIVTQELQTKAKRLSEWFRHYFYQEYKPRLGIHLVNNFCIMAEPFNMILQVAGNSQNNIQEGQNISNTMIQLRDNSENKFYLKKNLLAQGVATSKYVFVRNIKSIGHFFQIQLTETGNVLNLPDHLSQSLQKDMNYCAVTRYNQKFILKHHKTCQLSKLSYVCNETTPIKELLANIDIYDSKDQQPRQQLRVDDLVMIEATVINFQGRLHLYHKQYQMLVSQDFIDKLSDDERRQLLEQGRLAYLYQGIIGVIDRSSESTGKLFYVHLFTNQPKSRFFPQEKIEQLNKKAGYKENYDMEKKFTKQIEQKLANLVEKSDFEKTVSMLIEPIKSDVLLYRLAHTIFE